jgi:cysteinyl-tRNA synthetase
MSKSLGNFLTIRDALEIYHPEVLRIFLLSKHYRSPLDFSKSAVVEFQSALARIYRTLQRIAEFVEKQIGTDPGDKGERRDGLSEQFIDVMDDDLNTAGGIALLFDKVKEMNRLMDTIGDPPDQKLVQKLLQEREELLAAAAVLGLLEEKPEEFFQKISSQSLSMSEEAKARAEKRWADADAVRKRLQDAGIVLEDGPKGTTWRVELR